MSFDSGFKKIALSIDPYPKNPVLRGAAKAGGHVLGAGFKGANKILGGPIGTAFTLVSAGKSYHQNLDKMLGAGSRA